MPNLPNTVATANSNQAPLNQQPPTLLLTAGVQDPVAQQNFDILNKTLYQRLQGKTQGSANIVFGPALPNTGAFTLPQGTSIQRPGQLQLQITTQGNPVRLKLAPFQYSGSATMPINYASFFGLADDSGDVDTLEATFGWIRINRGQQTFISAVSHITEVELPGGVSPNPLIFQVAIPPPAFEMDDVVPSGSYVYQFFYQLAAATHLLVYKNIQAVAYELR